MEFYPHWYFNELSAAKQGIKTYCSGTMPVSCPETIRFSKNNLDAVSKFTDGQEVTVIGTISDIGEVMGYTLDVETIK